MKKGWIVSALVLSAFALAQQPNNTAAPTDEDLLVPSAQLDTILQNAVTKDTGQPAGISARLFNSKTYSATLIRLIAPDHPHAHGNTAEAFIVKEGEGVLETGGALVCPCSGDSAIHKDIFADKAMAQQQQAAPQQAARQGDPHNGSADSIEGGRKQLVKAGDVVLVPLGVPHTWVEIHKPVVYLDIKFQ